MVVYLQLVMGTMTNVFGMLTFAHLLLYSSYYNEVYWYIVLFVDLCTTTGVCKVAAELGKVKEMYTRICVLVEKDSEKKSDPSKWVS